MERIDEWSAPAGPIRSVRVTRKCPAPWHLSLLNLIVNAIESTSAAIDGRRELLVATTKAASDCVLVTMRDWGKGIDLDRAERVFDAFYTTNPAACHPGAWRPPVRHAQ